jgi:hypothetical protein
MTNKRKMLVQSTTLEPKGIQQVVLLYPRGTRIQMLSAERQNLSHLLSYLWETWQARKLLHLGVDSRKACQRAAGMRWWNKRKSFCNGANRG